MEEINTVILENGLEYMEMDEVSYNNNRYILLVNYKNVKDSCIRRLVLEEDGQEYFYKVKDELEYNKVLNLFVQKNKALF